MAVVLGILAKIGAIAGVLFGVFSLACGLYVLSSWVEEYPRQARKAIHYTALALDAILVLTLFDGLSLWRVAITLAANYVYLQNLHTFPMVSLGGPVFLLSCGLTISNHFMWFFYFIKHLGYSFGQVCSFMLLCVWLVPLALFVSLTPEDAALPSGGSGEGGRKSRQNMFKAMFARFVRSSDEPQSLHVD
ncbi:erv26 super protein [Coemansia sp. RSA 2703]|nr:erv26 super protein [Coemansia sp. RSA 2703]KAJ2375897.1 erv26 super protein [Coemansia sp. RSA 2607]KAJ2379698.1 erv26 super protein [Coemansia sp. RSA 2603]